VLEHVRELDGRRLVRVDRGPVAPRGAAQREELDARERDERGLLEALEARLKEHVARVRFSGRLVESPAVLVAAEGKPGPNLERMLRQSGQPVPATKPTLELNPEHALVQRLSAMAAESPPSERLGDYAELLLGQACLAAGEPLPDPGRFGRVLNELLLAAS
jgi:molecular chaperone HtpG